MTGTSKRHQVSDTAALVMLWANEYYQENPLIREYLQHLDLSAGKDLLDCYNRICPWYSEVIINRKHFIQSTVRDLVVQTQGKITIVNLGAGFSPLALELVDLLSSRCRFIEIDQSSMDRKHVLYTRLVPEHCELISCIEADINDIPSLVTDLEGIGDSHLITVMEGLSYYIEKPVMENLFPALSGISAEQSIVFEHLKPCHLISDDRRFIPYRIFSHVRDYTTLDRMTTYSDEDIRAMLPAGFISSYYNMNEMEWKRTGTNTFFPTPDSGWLSCAVAVRRKEDQVRLHS